VTDGGFTPDEAALLASLLDETIPPSTDGRMPGAGALDLVPGMARTAARMPMLRPVLEYGLGALADLARARHPDGWAALSAAERRAVFGEFAASDQFFMPALLFLVYAEYYRHPRVVAALGLEPRAPHPAGHAMEPDDWALLEPVRARARPR